MPAPRRGRPEPAPDLDPDVLAIAQEEARGLRFVPGHMEWLLTDALAPHPRNANEGDVGAIAESVETVGFYGLVMVRPVWTDEPSGAHFQILAGEHRWRALSAKNAPRVPCWVVDVDDATALRMLLDNAFTRRGRDRLDVLTENLRELAGTDAGLAGTPFDGDDLDAMLAELDPHPPARTFSPPRALPPSSTPATERCSCCGQSIPTGT